jgi:hypothetical protein
MAETDGARALLEPRCGGTEDPEYQGIAFKSFELMCMSYVLIHFEL